MEAQYTILGILDTGPNYGYALKKIHDQLFGAGRKLAYGQIYATLSRLLRDGKVKPSADREESGGPDRVKYEITPKGHTDFVTWLETPEAPAPHLQATLYIKTVLAIIRDGEAATYLEAQRRTHLARMRSLTAQRQTVPLAERLLIDHALYHLEADLRWIDITTNRLTQLKEELCQNR